MSNFGAILTNAGAAKLANAIALGVPLKLTQMAVGDGNGQPVTPDPEMAAIPGEKRRAAINTLFADPLAASQLVAEQIIPEDVGGWWIRCVGLYDDSNTLIAIANVPDTYKPLLASGAGRTQIIRMVLIVSDTNSVELKIDPAVVLATRKYVDDVMKAHKESRDHPYATTELAGLIKVATPEEALAGSPVPKAITPSLFRDLAQPRRLIKDAGSSGVSFAKLCDMERDPGVGRVGICALVTGGSDFAGTVVPSYLVSFSTRSYNGSASTLGRHVNVTFLGPGEHSPAVAFLVRDTGTRVELWMQIAQWPYPATMQILFEQGGRILPEQPTHERPAGAVEATVHRPFTTLSPPTAATVGLGAVANFPAASSLEDGSSQKYATAELTYQLAHLLQLHAAGPNHPHATTAEDGMMRIATQEQTEAGVADNVAVTPKTLGNHYKKSNILGAVGLLAGVPTGAVIESGSNANGSYMKLANGWMIALKNVSFPLVTLNSDSFQILSIGGETAWPWPARFAEIPFISIQFSGPQSYAFTVQSEHISEAAVGSFHLRNSWPLLMQTQPNLLVIAIGKW